MQSSPSKGITTGLNTLVDYFVLAEFDINLGSVVRYQHPAAIPGVETGVIASYMLPEGGHNRAEDTTYFILNRRKAKDQQAEITRIQTEGPLNFLSQKFLSAERLETLRSFVQKGRVFQQQDIQVKLYQIIDLNWISFYSEQDQRSLTLKIVNRGPDYYVTVVDSSNDKSISLEVKLHPFLNFDSVQTEVLASAKFLFQNEKGNIFGVELINANETSRKDINELLQALKFSPYSLIEKEVLNNQGNQIHFINIMKNRLDTKAKRGAVQMLLFVKLIYEKIYIFIL